MTANSPLVPDHQLVPCHQDKDKGMQYFSQKDMAQFYPARMRFSLMLRRAFPGPSDAAVAAKAAPVLGVSSRQVQNWLQCRNDAGVGNVLAVIAIIGAETVFNILSS
jgi:hypothetical protein